MCKLYTNKDSNMTTLFFAYFKATTCIEGIDVKKHNI